MMEKCLEHTHFQAKAPYDKERFDLKKRTNKRKRHFKKSPGQRKRVKYSFI
uniref:hypothetical protein n=1 Tax=Wolbachia endosymbiont (group A) of Gymnosoma rotundatum TaxID=2954016 RepID=UPI00222705BE|nr:hypothetical protein [Wolbachia endosymbiont (group A) of Gymnosoma rotundatum]